FWSQRFKIRLDLRAGDPIRDQAVDPYPLALPEPSKRSRQPDDPHFRDVIPWSLGIAVRQCRCRSDVDDCSSAFAAHCLDTVTSAVHCAQQVYLDCFEPVFQRNLRMIPGPRGIVYDDIDAAKALFSKRDQRFDIPLNRNVGSKKCGTAPVVLDQIKRLTAARFIYVRHNHKGALSGQSTGLSAARAAPA